MPELYKRKGSPYWFINGYSDGKRIRRSTGTANKKEAERILHSISDKINRNEFFIREEIPSSQFTEKYLLYSQNHNPKALTN